VGEGPNIVTRVDAAARGGQVSPPVTALRPADTMSDDQPFYAPDHKPASPRHPQPGELLWTIRKDGRQYDCELRDHGVWGVEVQVYREREFLYGRRWATRALALEEAAERKSHYLREGGVLMVDG
jgi:hypothetical protein